MSLIKKLAGETAIYGLSSIVGRFLNFLLLPLYSRVLLPGEYGVVTDLYATSAFLMVIYSYRMESAFFRFGTPAADRESTFSVAMQSLLVTTTILTAGLWVAAEPLAGLLTYPQHPEYVRWFALILAFDCLAEVPFARLRLEQRPGRFVTAKLVNIGANVLLNVFWLLFCPWAAQHGMNWVHWVWVPGVGVGYIFLSNVIASALTLLFLLSEFRAIRWRFDRGKVTDSQTGVDFESKVQPNHWTFDRVLWTKMMAYAWPLIIVGFAGIVNEMLSRTMMKYLLTGTKEENLAQLGIFGANYKLAMLITLFTQAYRYAAEPFFFRHAADKDALRIQANVTKWFTIASTAGMLGILLFLDVVKYFLGTKFHGGLDIVPILLVANLLLGLYYNFSVWYRLKDRTGLGAWISLAGAALTILLNILWIPRFGYVGAAWVTLLCYAFMSWATWQTGRRHYPVPYELGRMGLYVAVALALFGGSKWIEPTLMAWPTVLWAARVGLFLGFLGLVWVLEKGKKEVVV